MIPEVNIISKKASIDLGGSPSGGFGGQSPLRKCLCSTEHLHWLKIDLNAVKIITVETIKVQKINVNGSTHIQC